jgi:hypothetical protein
MSASAAKLAANRGNATLSTGPADTSRTRFNGLAHGLTSKQTVIPGENQEEYDVFLRDILKHLAPTSAIEIVLAERVAAAAWRLKRFTRVETAFYTNRIDAYLEENPNGNPDCALANLFTDPGEMSRMRLFLRYQNAVQREYDTAMRELHKAKAERLREEYERAALGIADPEPEAVAAAHNAVGFGSQEAFTAAAYHESEDAYEALEAQIPSRTPAVRAAAAA